MIRKSGAQLGAITIDLLRFRLERIVAYVRSEPGIGGGVIAGDLAVSAGATAVAKGFAGSHHRVVLLARQSQGDNQSVIVAAKLRIVPELFVAHKPHELAPPVLAPGGTEQDLRPIRRLALLAEIICDRVSWPVN